MIEVKKRKNDWLKIGQFILSLFAFLIAVFSAASCFAGGSILLTDTGLYTEERQVLLAFGSISIFLAVVHFFAMVNALKKPSRVKTTSLSESKSLLYASIAMFGWAIFLALNYFHFAEQSLLPIRLYLTPLFICIPIWWFIEFGKRNLPRLTLRKQTAALSLGSSYIIILIILIELIIFALIIAGILVYLNFQPVFQQFMNLITIPQDLTQFNMESIEHYFLIFLQNPWIVAAAVFLVGCAAPFIEESLKPAALWALRKRSLSPIHGFILGLYFGAAFAFFESAGMIIQFGAEAWVENILLRSATALLHITCSGLVGYGYACSMTQGKKSSLPKYLFLAVLLHGTWNTLAVLNSLTSLSETEGGWLSSSTWGTISVAALVLEWIFILSFLWKMNIKFKDEFHNKTHRNSDSRVTMNEVE